MQPNTNSYDEVPYRSFPFAQTHPARLATLATLFGMQPPAIGTARILELGCASGGNLIPMAMQLPEATLLGIDGSNRQVREGMEVVERLQLRNVELRQLDIKELVVQPGEFDYILCHGVYSWVPDDVQDAILRVFQLGLRPQGVGYISYNTYPGWHMRGTIRDIMRYRASSFDSPQMRLDQARGLLAFLSQSVDAEKSAYGILLKQELESIRRSDDSYLLHEHLEDINQLLYFHQFTERLVVVGLQYLGEAEFGAMSLENFPENVRTMLESVARDRIEREQYMGFLRNRAFRQSLVCRKEIALERSPSPETLLHCRVSSNSQPESGEVDIKSDQSVVFRGRGGVLRTNDPIVKAGITHLKAVWPLSIPFVKLSTIARSLVSGLPESIETDVLSPPSRRLAETLLRCFATGQVELTVTKPTFAASVSPQPRACSYARQQAQRSLDVTNRLHETIHLDDFQRKVLRCCDGRLDHQQIADEIINEFIHGASVMHKANQPIQSRDELATLVGDGFHWHWRLWHGLRCSLCEEWHTSRFNECRTQGLSEGAGRCSKDPR